MKEATRTHRFSFFLFFGAKINKESNESKKAYNLIQINKEKKNERKQERKAREKNEVLTK